MLGAGLVAIQDTLEDTIIRDHDLDENPATQALLAADADN
ncbi:MAG: hypothetical protein ACI9W4_002936 [Rhodothermales bacterium]|jgi:hypothetical protein